MALQKNKVKFGLNKVHWAKIMAWIVSLFLEYLASRLTRSMAQSHALQQCCGIFLQCSTVNRIGSPCNVMRLD